MDYYDPVTKKWSYERNDLDWHWPITFFLITAGTVVCVSILVTIIASALARI